MCRPRTCAWSSSTTTECSVPASGPKSVRSAGLCAAAATPPASFQSRSRRQHVMPELKPRSCGKCSHWIPVCSTYKIPHSTSRFGNDLRLRGRAARTRRDRPVPIPRSCPRRERGLFGHGHVVEKPDVARKKERSKSVISLREHQVTQKTAIWELVRIFARSSHATQRHDEQKPYQHPLRTPACGEQSTAERCKRMYRRHPRGCAGSHPRRYGRAHATEAAPARPGDHPRGRAPQPPRRPGTIRAGAGSRSLTATPVPVAEL